jgi:hypothetical protein
MESKRRAMETIDLEKRLRALEAESAGQWRLGRGWKGHGRGSGTPVSTGVLRSWSGNAGRPPKSCRCGAMVRRRPRGRRSLEPSCWLAQGCSPRDLLMAAPASARTRLPRCGLIWCTKSWHTKSTLKEGNVTVYLVKVYKASSALQRTTLPPLPIPLYAICQTNQCYIGSIFDSLDAGR